MPPVICGELGRTDVLGVVVGVPDRHNSLTHFLDGRHAGRLKGAAEKDLSQLRDIRPAIPECLIDTHVFTHLPEPGETFLTLRVRFARAEGMQEGP